MAFLALLLHRSYVARARAAAETGSEQQESYPFHPASIAETPLRTSDNCSAPMVRLSFLDLVDQEYNALGVRNPSGVTEPHSFHYLVNL